MADFTGEDLAGSRFEKVDLTGARFHNVDLTGAMIRGALLVNVDEEWEHRLYAERDLDLLHGTA